MGTWLLEPEDFAPWLMAGIEVPSFRLLAIRADGSFVLYRIYPYCEPLDASGRFISADQTLEYASRCTENVARARQDGFTVPLLHLSAAGRWQIYTDGRLVFITEVRSPVPEHARGLDFAAMRAKAEREARDAAGTRAGEISRELVPAFERHGHRLGNFFTTFFIFDGLPITYTIEEPFLGFTADRGATLTYHREQAEALDTALAASWVIHASPRYLFCMLEGIDKGEFGEFATRARAAAPVLERYGYASNLRRAGRNAEAERFMPQSQEDEFLRQYGELIQHPANRAQLAGTLGEYLGCPQLDRANERQRRR